MLKIDGKTFMNIQEAVQWLLDNNCIPFQCTADYQANTEIGLGTIVNPSPSKVRIGSLIFFADSKVSTVTGITETGFICSDQYNNLVDDIAYVTGVSINASGHLITTLSDGQTIDAGIVKQVSSFSINASQHLIANYNDGTTTDIGAIFSGNITISGNLTVTGGISGNAITGDSIIENMAGYSFASAPQENVTKEVIYAGAVKNGNKLTCVLYIKLNFGTAFTSNYVDLGRFILPQSVSDKLYPSTISGQDFLDIRELSALSSIYDIIKVSGYIVKSSYTPSFLMSFYGVSSLTKETDYFVRYEVTFLLSDSLAS